MDIKSLSTSHSIFLLILFTILIIPSTPYAQEPALDCQTPFKKGLSDCLKTSTACTNNCLDIHGSDQDGYKGCSAVCQSAGDACRTQTRGAFDACFNSTKNDSETSTMEEDSLVQEAPAETDLPFDEDTSQNPPYDSEGKLQGKVVGLDGPIDIQLGDGTWIVGDEGTVIPNDATIYTGYGAEATVQFSNHLIIHLRSLGELSIPKFESNSAQYRTELKLETGELRFKVQEGTLKTDMRVSTPNFRASVTGTDAGVYYNKETGISLFEIYDGTITVTNLETNEEQTISSAYGSPVTQIKAEQQGAMSTADISFDGQSETNYMTYLVLGGVGVAVGLFLARKKLKK